MVCMGRGRLYRAGREGGEKLELGENREGVTEKDALIFFPHYPLLSSVPVYHSENLCPIASCFHFVNIICHQSG